MIPENCKVEASMTSARVHIRIQYGSTQRAATGAGEVTAKRVLQSSLGVGAMSCFNRRLPIPSHVEINGRLLLTDAAVPTPTLALVELFSYVGPYQVSAFVLPIKFQV